MPTGMPSPSHLTLIGLRGAGKTTVGRMLADRLGLSFIDTDEIITAEAGMTIADIFATEGEPEFRRRETEAIRHATGMPPAVISVGGGAVLDSSNVVLLRNAGPVVWLTAPVDVLWKRIAQDKATASSRPSLTTAQGPEEMKQLLTTREPLYRAAADLRIDTDDVSPDEIVELILRLMATM